MFPMSDARTRKNKRSLRSYLKLKDRVTLLKNSSIRIGNLRKDCSGRHIYRCPFRICLEATSNV